MRNANNNNLIISNSERDTLYGSSWQRWGLTVEEFNPVYLGTVSFTPTITWSDCMQVTPTVTSIQTNDFIVSDTDTAGNYQNIMKRDSVFTTVCSTCG